MVKICPECGTEQENRFTYCKNCGTLLPEYENTSENKEEDSKKVKNCPDCGTKQDITTKFCKNCGTPLQEENDNENNKTEAENKEKNIKYCRHCGAEIDPYATFCSNCGKSQDMNVNSPKQKHAFLSLILSFFIPGLGQIYNNQTHKGFILIIAYIISYILTLIFIGAILFLIIWIYGMYDAYTTAKAINRGEFVEDKFILNK